MNGHDTSDPVGVRAITPGSSDAALSSRRDDSTATAEPVSGFVICALV